MLSGSVFEARQVVGTSQLQVHARQVGPHGQDCLEPSCGRLGLAEAHFDPTEEEEPLDACFLARRLGLLEEPARVLDRLCGVSAIC